jgi:hypothetical protein
VPKKKGKPSQRSRQGLSGNPQRRAAQLESPVLSRACSLAWPSDPGGIEELTCQLLGDSQPAGLGALIVAAGTAARMTAGTGAGRALWALQQGLALITPSSPPVVGLPNAEDPLEMARAEVARTAEMLGVGWLSAARLAGAPLLARDVYGSRFLLTAPFSYSASQSADQPFSPAPSEPPDHWYAWDIDVCWLGRTLYAGTFATDEAALKDWRDAVGVPEAVLVPCPPDLMTGLLRPLLSDEYESREPRPILREYYRMRRRARDIATLPDSVEIVDPDEMVSEFSRWYHSLHGAVPPAVRSAADIIADQWGPVHAVPDERVSRGCSPHRIRQTATLIGDARGALELLPEWTRWCIDSTGLTGQAAERALETATASANGVSVDEGHWRVRE